MSKKLFAKNIYRLSLFLIKSLCGYISYGQTLTIETGGQTGTSGTNWSVS